MHLRHGHLRHRLVTGLALALASPLVLPAPAAHAGLESGVESIFAEHYRDDCSTSQQFTAPPRRDMVAGQWLTRSVAGTFTATSWDDTSLTSTAKFALQSRVRVQESAGRPRKVEMIATGTGSLTMSGPVPCPGETRLVDLANMDLTLPDAQLVTVTTVRRGRTTASAVQVLPEQEGFQMLHEQGVGGSERNSRTVLAPRGGLGLLLQAGVGTRSMSAVPHGNNSVAVTVLFRDPGAATGQVTGEGRRFITPTGRSCARGAVGLRAGKKSTLRKVRKIVVSAGGKKIGVLRAKKLRPGRAVELRVPGGFHGAVTAKVVLKKGGSRKVSRSYLPCTV